MRKLSAHYIFDGTQFHKDSILCIDDVGCIVSLLENQHLDREQAGVEFYSGILIPGFVNAYTCIDTLQDAKSEQFGTMRREGIVAYADVRRSLSHREIDSSIYFRTFLQLNEADGDTYLDGKRVFNQYRRDFPLSLSPYSIETCSQTLFRRIAEHSENYAYPVMVYSENHNYEYVMWLSEKTHLLIIQQSPISQEEIAWILSIRPADTFTFVLPVTDTCSVETDLYAPLSRAHVSVAFSTGTDSSLSIIQNLYSAQERWGISLDMLLHSATYTGAKALDISSTYGCFSVGRTPGVLLLESVDMHRMALTEQTMIRRII